MWAYRSAEVQLTSNRSYGDRQAALDSARRAFPAVAADRIHVREVDAASPSVKHRVLAFIVLLVTSRRRGNRQSPG
jgi:hypothetical protein